MIGARRSIVDDHLVSEVQTQHTWQWRFFAAHTFHLPQATSVVIDVDPARQAVQSTVTSHDPGATTATETIDAASPRRLPILTDTFPARTLAPLPWLPTP